MLNIIEPQRKKARLSSDISTHINDTTSKTQLEKLRAHLDILLEFSLVLMKIISCTFQKV